MPPIEEIFRALIDRGLLAPSPEPVALPGGNRDRRLPRGSWQAHSPEGRPLKLTVGHNLGPNYERHLEAHASCRDLVPEPAFFEQLPGAEVFAEAYIAGEQVDSPDSDGTPDPRRYRDALRRVRTQLAASEQPSTEAARLREWNQWSARLLEKGAFHETERTVLSGQILPALRRHLCSGPVSTRWSNGDFRPGNILVDTRGRPWLIDHEFGARTHFFAEDEVRFLAFTPEARNQPDLLPSSVFHDVAWQLRFWLGQFLLESEHNTPTYHARFSETRKALIRRLAESMLGKPLTGWSVPTLPVDYALEDVRWLQHEDLVLFVSGWAHVPGSSGLEQFELVAPGAPATLLFPLPRPDVQRHFKDTPATQVGGFSGRRHADFPDTRFTLALTTNEGWWLPLQTFAAHDTAARGPSTGHYAAWALRHDRDPVAMSEIRDASTRFSVLVPVYNTPPRFLTECLASVRSQTYPHWELVLVDDASSRSDTITLLERAAKEAHTQLYRRNENGGIARATNDALARATGDYIVLLDHDDVLRPHALASLAGMLLKHPEADVIYSDEDKITEDGRRIFPFFKPAFSPEFLRGVMYPGHVLCVRRQLAIEAGGFDPAFDGVQDYEFFLRLSERTRRIQHLPAILYHWRQSPGSSALHGNIKGDMDTRQLAAVGAHLARQGDHRIAEAAGGHRIRLRADPCGPSPEVQFLQGRADDTVVELLTDSAPSGNAEVLIVVCDPSIVIDDSCIRELCALALRPDAGCVAPLLLSEDGRILESGCTFSNGRLIPMMVGFDPDDDGYNGASLCNREVAALSPVCFALRRSVVLEVEAAPKTWIGFTEALRAIGYFHRVATAARVNIPRTYSRLPHGTLSRHAGSSDPYYNPAFRREPADYAFTAPARSSVADERFHGHVDTPPSPRLTDGCLALRGWCAHDSGKPLLLEIRSGPIAWRVPVDLKRTDVAQAFRRSDFARSGFAARLRLPAGHHQLEVEAQHADGRRWSVGNYPVTVPWAADWVRCLGGPPDSMLACQLAVSAQHAPRPIAPPRVPRRRRSSAWPRFSIVTPSYQHASFLKETLRSVLSQEVEGEYVVQDGGSTDASVAVMNEVKREFHAGTSLRMTGWESTPDSGQTDALSRGFAKTAGEPQDVMAWINSDDFYLPGALPEVAHYFAHNPEVDVVYGHRMLVDAESREIGRWYLPCHDAEVLRHYDFVPQETLFWRRRIWERVGGLDLDFQFAMDWDLLLRFQASGERIVRLPRFLACFRVHHAQKTSSQIGSTGQAELDVLRYRTLGRIPSPEELIGQPSLQAYLRSSARLELAARLGFQGRAG